ncbi:MAG TPA: TIGR04255 family protein, partial [Gemmatimonadales bacterium]|nr:TIGR04255 family protein [Gemmatimonadales bacterium]
MTIPREANDLRGVVALPIRLEQPPLEEATFEVRFAPSVDSVVNLLPGIFFAKLGSQYTRSESLPLASLPLPIRKAEPNLRYQQQIRLIGESLAIFIGDCVAGVSILAPYQGWAEFEPRILEFLQTLHASGLASKVERASMKAVNLIPAADQSGLDMLNVHVEIAGAPPPGVGFRLRAELADGRMIQILEISPSAQLTSPNGRAGSGVLIAVDSILSIDGEEFWSDFV